ncbi:hypothetical protein TNIN_198691 [Trichonephila inaurata madagascariensis]|uniref:Uncharacterized protein n=1 Tax=Trichonephila inaurata madagascariensis TaxID=2747483 RepID=A0A8X6YWG8_9ARAC|nr:hypothetical protein TNIN_198691 [Trichonephila inaurata madagascariensis]
MLSSRRTQSEDLEAPPFSHPVLWQHFRFQGLPDSPGERVCTAHRRHHAPVRGGVRLPCEPSPCSKRHPQDTCPGTTFCSTGSLERKGYHPEGKSGHFSLQRVRHSTTRRYLDSRARRNSAVLMKKISIPLSNEIKPTFPIVFQSSSLPSGVRQILGGAQLQIASADVHHAGSYRCTADNDVGEPASAVLVLTVLYAPELIVSPEWIHGDEGATVEFTCTCHSAPPSHIVWVKTGQETPLQASDRVKLKHKLTPPTTTEAWIKLQRLRKEDLGSYTCLAKNSVGQSTKTVEISGLAEPVQLRGDQSSETSFLLMWTAKSYSPIIEYQLKIRRYKSDDEWTDVMIPVSEESLQQSLFFSHSYNVTGLEPGTRYEAVLQAHNDFGWNRPSETLLFSAGKCIY